VGFLIVDNLNFNVLENEAKKQIKSIKKLAKDEITLALENKKTFDLFLQITAPTVLNY
jgi:hypothetical protein